MGGKDDLRMENSILMCEAMGGPRQGQHRSKGIKERGENPQKSPQKRSSSHWRRRLRSVLREETQIPVEEVAVGAGAGVRGRFGAGSSFPCVIPVGNPQSRGICGPGVGGEQFASQKPGKEERRVGRKGREWWWGIKGENLMKTERKEGEKEGKEEREKIKG